MEKTAAGRKSDQGFYRLWTGVAGAILQKFATYRHRVAAALIPELANQGRFRDLVLEANRGNQLHIFYDQDAAERWLLEGD